MDRGGVSIDTGENNLAVFEHGPAFWIGVVGYSYLIISIAVFFLAISIFRYPQSYRNQGFSLIFGILIPWVGNLLHISGLGPFLEIDLTPLVVIFMGLVMAINLTTNRLFDLMPVARETLIDTTPDGMLVLDDQGRLIDFNTAARDLLAHEIMLEIGIPGNQIFARWPEILPFLSGCLTDEHKMTLNDGRGRYLVCKVIPIGGSVQNTAGRLMIMHDSTQAVLIEEEISITNALLRAQLDEIEQLQDSLRAQAVRDALTGLFNRRYLAESLQREFARAVRDQSSISICILDLDHFKIFNDTHGHMAGDEMLKHLGAFLEENTRVDDITCQYGGEEFVIVIPMLTCEEALQRLENIRNLFQKTPTIYQDEPFFGTFSDGMATFPQHGKSPQDIMMAADRALYKAKALGRNCIMTAQHK